MIKMKSYRFYRDDILKRCRRIKNFIYKKYIDFLNGGLFTEKELKIIINEINSIEDIINLEFHYDIKNNLVKETKNDK